MKPFGSLIALLPCLLFSSVAPAHATSAFTEAQRCRVKTTIDVVCFQQNRDRFESFVLEEEGSWFQKSIVADALLQSYPASGAAAEVERTVAVRAKAKVYGEAFHELTVPEQAEVEDCKEEGNPDACLVSRYCFKEGYLKIKNFLAKDSPEKFAAELRWFAKAARKSCD